MKLAVMVDDLMISQESFYLIKNLNVLSDDIENQVYCFYNNLSSICIPPKFALMHSYYLNYFNNGSVICTNLSNLENLLKYHTKVKKYLYLWDLEWLRGKSDYMKNIALLNSDVSIIARSDNHANVIENYCNKTVSHIIDNWDHTKLRLL